MILAGDIGGTKTNLALFDRKAGTLELLVQKSFLSPEHNSLEEVVQQFMDENAQQISHACFGVAGPVRQGRVEATNLSWVVDAHQLKSELGFSWVELLNDLEANAYGIPALPADDFAVLNEGTKRVQGNAVVIAAGTGLGEAVLYWDGERHIPSASEGGHCDFAPGNELEIELWRYLQKRFGHVSYERVLSGPGLLSIYNFLKETRRGAEPPWLAEKVADGGSAAISEAALAHTSELAVQALDIFTSLYGAEAGNLALKVMATGGVYVGGGIAPKILEKLQDGTFLKAFVAKGRLEYLMQTIPVWVILNDTAALLGAARYASMHEAGEEVK